MKLSTRRSDHLLLSLEELELEIVPDLPVPPGAEKKRKNGRGKSRNGAEDKGSRRIDDPVRMYLTQMGEIPLLTRNQEIALAKKIEITRKRYRRQLLECDFATKVAFEILAKVHVGELPLTARLKSPLPRGWRKTRSWAACPIT